MWKRADSYAAENLAACPDGCSQLWLGPQLQVHLELGDRRRWKTIDGLVGRGWEPTESQPEPAEMRASLKTQEANPGIEPHYTACTAMM